MSRSISLAGTVKDAVLTWFYLFKAVSFFRLFRCVCCLIEANVDTAVLRVANLTSGYNEPMDEENVSPRKTVLRKIRNELAYELIFVVACLALAISFNLKIVLAVVLTCLKFAIPDFVTASLVFRHDPSRAHGAGVGFLFLAMGMLRASLFAFIAMLVACVVIMPVFAGLAGRNQIAIGLGTGFVCAFGFLGSVFPLSFVAVVIARFSSVRLSFASQLTQLRRSSESSRGKIELSVSQSIKRISVASGIGLTVCLIGCLFLFPLEGAVLALVLPIMLSAFVMPFIWMVFMALTILPEDAGEI
ncbi:MAG: hypothetical protein AB8B55_13625 [Mariniblastus sp.]